MKGIYVLIIQLKQAAHVAVGKLGTLCFAEGLYAYVGSAQNGLEKRIEHHFKRAKRTFWHVHYLLQNPFSAIVKVFYKNAGKVDECAIAEKIGREGEAVPGFGCSDCHCKSHLFRVRAYDFLSEFMQEYKMAKLSASS